MVDMETAGLVAALGGEFSSSGLKGTDRKGGEGNGPA